MDLHTLSKVILLIEGKPISKVRLAKTIYFVHKELIRANCLSTSDISYIRMPLGPVPYGFMTLATDFPDILTSRVMSGLAYNTVEYSVKPKRTLLPRKKNALVIKIEDILTTLRDFRTSDLVEISHDDPSWKENANGQRYTIAEQDLNKVLPKRSEMKISVADSDDQLLQASLVKGMIDDIVNESTDLEHPIDE